MALPVLPKFDPNPAARSAALAQAQDTYRYSHDTLPPVATLDLLPEADHFDVRYNVLQLETMSGIAANMADVAVRDGFAPFDALSDYEGFYPRLPKPRGLTGYLHDRVFARQRVAGPNPMVLRAARDESDLSLFAIEDDRWQALTGTASPRVALEARSLFIADYRELSAMVAGSHAGRPKWVAPAVALFQWRRAGIGDRGGLVPLAIRLGPKAPVVTPHDGAAWQAAKLHVQVADANHHEMSTHLGRAHLALEPFAIATKRRLAPNHPVRVLLEPHLRFVLVRNALARQTLLRPTGPVDRLLAATLDSSISIATEAVRTWHFDRFKLPNELSARGVMDAEVLPDFPYRDDGLLLWEAIGAFTSAYCAIYYANPADLEGDMELQAWLREIGAPDGGRIQGLPGRLNGASDVAAVLQQILFVSGPQHSAVNYPQWDYMGTPLSMPLAAYAAPDATPDTSADVSAALLPILPPADQVRDQIEVVRFLSGFRYDRFGVYRSGWFEDPRAQEAVLDFQTALRLAETRIHDRNTRRVEPYEYLLPSNVLNSASI